MDFPDVKEFKLRKDQYRKARGGAAMWLFVACSNCEEPIALYQKDGPGKLLRMYCDRIAWPPDLVKESSPDNIKDLGGIACKPCNNTIANPMVYEPENRAAYRLVPGSVHIYRSAVKALAHRKTS